ncbi:GNAT family N-acetyltransferase [bacterium]|nr:MAG: GNAT family N-acetyltransferase [bacterium]
MMTTEFEIKITKDRSEIREAQKLRFEVFNLEMKKGLECSYQRGLDADDYDPLCEHLIVRDLNSRKVVGTYRLLLGSEARSHFGFYSEREFNLENIKRLSGELLELGRSCAHKDYRDRALISLMWDAIAEYIKTHKIRYIFGCASLLTTHPPEVSELFSYLKEKYYAPEELRVYPVPEKSFPELDENVKIRDEQAIFLRLPSLIKGYLRVGAFLCGPPALDLEFGTTDLFLLLDVTKMSTEYRRRFSFTGSKVQNAAG